MSLLTALDPLKAMELYFEGEESGAWEGEFIKNEKQRGLIYPPKLKEFLLRFGYLRVNRGVFNFWLPDNVQIINVPFEDRKRKMLVLGELKERCVGIFADECDMEDPPVSFGEIMETEEAGSTLSLSATDFTLNDILTYLFTENMFLFSGGTSYFEHNDIASLVRKYTAMNRDFEKLMLSQKRPCAHICFDEEANEFVCMELGGDYDIIMVFPRFITIEELEALFRKEFYQNSLNCDFAHCLKLAEEIIRNYEENKEETDPLKLGEMYRVAGRCCWVLKQWEKAEDWLKKAEPVYSSEAIPVESAQSFYQGLGNFYSDMGEEEKSAAAYEKSDSLSGGNCRLKGDRFLRKGRELEEQDRLEEAIEYYEKALAEYKKDPKECKYDIARSSQLKGDAKHILKERKKAAESAKS